MRESLVQMDLAGQHLHNFRLVSVDLCPAVRMNDRHVCSSLEYR